MSWSLLVDRLGSASRRSSQRSRLAGAAVVVGVVPSPSLHRPAQRSEQALARRAAGGRGDHGAAAGRSLPAVRRAADSRRRPDRRDHRAHPGDRSMRRAGRGHRRGDQPRGDRRDGTGLPHGLGESIGAAGGVEPQLRAREHGRPTRRSCSCPAPAPSTSTRRFPPMSSSTSPPSFAPAPGAVASGRFVASAPQRLLDTRVDRSAWHRRTPGAVAAGSARRTPSRSR